MSPECSFKAASMQKKARPALVNSLCFFAFEIEADVMSSRLRFFANRKNAYENEPDTADGSRNRIRLP